LGDAYLRSNLREKAMLQYNDAAKFADDTSAKQKLEMKMQTLRNGNGGTQTERMPASQTQE
jgi:predicted negative regulator of RcsB-dependent stress response